MKTARELIDDLVTTHGGSLLGAAQSLGIEKNKLNIWRYRNRIPFEERLHFMKVANRYGAGLKLEEFLGGTVANGSVSKRRPKAKRKTATRRKAGGST